MNNILVIRLVIIILLNRVLSQINKLLPQSDDTHYLGIRPDSKPESPLVAKSLFHQLLLPILRNILWSETSPLFSSVATPIYF
jgi:hypothetical protein